MPALTMSDSGLCFQPSSGLDSALPPAFSLTLTDGLIEEMIKCVQNMKPIQLLLGHQPILHYGTKKLPLFISTSTHSHELYRCCPNSSSFAFQPGGDAAQKSKGNSSKLAVVAAGSDVEPQLVARLSLDSLSVKQPSSSPLSSVSSSTVSNPKSMSTTAGTDAALAQLQSSMASENAKKAGNSTKFVKELLPLSKKGASATKLGYHTAKFLSSSINSRTGEATRSMPTSPSLAGVHSPLLGPTSVPLSQKQAEQVKVARKPLVHLLALGPMTQEELERRVPASSIADLEQALNKVGDLDDHNRWTLRKHFYKELDVYSFNYNTDDDRRKAIENAVKQYDKMRLGVPEPEWDRLLRKEERGTGKCLSKLQAQIAQGPVSKAPKNTLRKADDQNLDPVSGIDGRGEEPTTIQKPPRQREDDITRSSSQPPPAQSKRSRDAEQRAKGNLAKSSLSTLRSAATKKEKVPPKGGSKVLSSQFVSESDEEDELADIVGDNSQSSTALKRPRFEEVDTSDSNVPLSKKVKKETSSHRVSDASRSSNASNTTSLSSSKPKGGSTQKSSPLASSPPTNASEFEQSSGDTSVSASPLEFSLKSNRSPFHKRHQKSSSVASSASTSSSRSLKPEVVDLARKYRVYYPKYEALHREVAVLGQGGKRDNEKEQKLLEMHQRLSGMKKDILAGIVEAH